MGRVPGSAATLLLAVLVVLAGCASVAVPEPVGGTVEPSAVDVTVIDGDTVVVRAANDTVVLERSYG